MRALYKASILLALLASPCFGQQNAYQAEREVGRLLSEAKEAYDELEFEQSDASLQSAIVMIERFNLQSADAAEVYMQHAIVLHGLEKNSEAVKDAFVKALRVNPEAQLSANVSTPSLKAVFDQAVQVVGAQTTGATAPSDRDLIHYPVKTIQSGEALPLSISVSDVLNRQIYRAYLYFRSEAAETMQQLEMRPQGERDFVARIPNRFVVGQTLKYYIAVEDRSGNRLTQYGSGKEPVVVQITTPLSRNEDDRMGSSLDGSDSSWDSDSSSRKYVGITLNVGTGAGYITDRAEPVNRPKSAINPGMAMTPFHSLIELDFNVTDWFSLGAFSRLQIVEFAHLEGGRAKFKVADNGHHSLTLRVGGGIGQVRHLVDLGDALDTTKEGPYCYTLGLSYHWTFSNHFALAVTPDFYHLMGDSPSFQFDLSIGVRASF